ncbi:MAG: hypothetical protein ACK556_17375, partial [Pseudanabaena sp.]
MLPLIAIAMLLFTACSNSSTDGKSNASMPVTDTTKDSPTPTSTQNNPSPNLTNAANQITSLAKSPKPTPTIDFSKLPELEIGELELYKHRSGILEINVPKDWQV